MMEWQNILRHLLDFSQSLGFICQVDLAAASCEPGSPQVPRSARLLARGGRAASTPFGSQRQEGGRQRRKLLGLQKGRQEAEQNARGLPGLASWDLSRFMFPTSRMSSNKCGLPAPAFFLVHNPQKAPRRHCNGVIGDGNPSRNCGGVSWVSSLAEDGGVGGGGGNGSQVGHDDEGGQVRPRQQNAHKHTYTRTHIVLYPLLTLTDSKQQRHQRKKKMGKNNKKKRHRDKLRGAARSVRMQHT